MWSRIAEEHDFRRYNLNPNNIEGDASINAIPMWICSVCDLMVYEDPNLFSGL